MTLPGSQTGSLHAVGGVQGRPPSTGRWTGREGRPMWHNYASPNPGSSTRTPLPRYTTQERTQVSQPGLRLAWALRPTARSPPE